MIPSWCIVSMLTPRISVRSGPPCRAKRFKLWSSVIEIGGCGVVGGFEDGDSGTCLSFLRARCVRFSEGVSGNKAVTSLLSMLDDLEDSSVSMDLNAVLVGRVSYKKYVGIR